jgi:hypothetical protein
VLFSLASVIGVLYVNVISAMVARQSCGDVRPRCGPPLPVCMCARIFKANLHVIIISLRGANISLKIDTIKGS